jgi:hypothetical protein
VGIKRASSYQGAGPRHEPIPSDGITCLNPQLAGMGMVGARSVAPDRSQSALSLSGITTCLRICGSAKNHLASRWAWFLGGVTPAFEGFQRSSVVPRGDRMVRSALRRTPPIFNIQ